MSVLDTFLYTLVVHPVFYCILLVDHLWCNFFVGPLHIGGPFFGSVVHLDFVTKFTGGSFLGEVSGLTTIHWSSFNKHATKVKNITIGLSCTDAWLVILGKIPPTIDD